MAVSNSCVCVYNSSRNDDDADNDQDKRNVDQLNEKIVFFFTPFRTSLLSSVIYFPKNNIERKN